ncbi:hypothetical protein [Lactococcus lactis]|uniref:hypothetical protein n=1 Tax=Lactococcus lactis TaxID=1358 RepID=UPI0024A82F4F|nr:hypothetical protein [Lactococcus lactis]
MNKIDKLTKTLFFGFLSIVAGYFINDWISKGIILKYFRFNPYKGFGGLMGQSFTLFLILFMITFFMIVYFIAQIIGFLIEQRWFYGVTTIPLLIVMIGFNLLTQNQLLSINTYKSEARSLEIIRPYITDKQYIKLNSDLLQVESKDSFNKINKQVREIAEKNHANID